MKEKTFIFCIAIIVTLAIGGCKKNSSSEVTPSFKADSVFTLIKTNAFPNYNGISSIAIDPAGNKIFYYYPNATDGFSIDMFDITTGSISTIYKHFLQSGLSSWLASNGSEGMRLRYFSNTFDGNKLIVPGGATNNSLVEIRVNADYSTTFLQVYNDPNTSNGLDVRGPYDVDLIKTATFNQFSVVSMWNSVYGINTIYSAFPVSPTSHGSSIVGTPGGKEYIFCGHNQTLELYNNGVFIRSVMLPSGESQLQMDSKNRIYAYNGTSIFRFSSDLLTKEEFRVTGSLQGYRQEAMVIKEMPSYVQVYSFSNKDLIGMRLPL